MPMEMTSLAFNLFYSMELNEGELFKGLLESVNENKEAWTEWATCERPHMTDLPCGWQEKLMPFHRLLLLRVFRPEKLLYAFQIYVRDQMG